jgi:eukaryotic-like serine/threonine-protein kinase
MSAILTEDPPPIERDIPAPLRWTIDRCLAKDPGDRYESSGDLFRELRQIRDYAGSKTASQIEPAVVPVRTRRRIRPLFPIVGTLGMIAAFAVGRYFTEQRFPDQAAFRFTPFAFDPGGQGAPVWSPDGKAVAYSGHPGGATTPQQVMVRFLDAAMPQQVTSVPEGAYPIAWAPDSMRILFRSDHAPVGIWSASTVGGEPESFCAIPDSVAGAVSPDLKSVALIRRGPNGEYALWTSSPPGTPPQPYTPDPIHAKSLYNETRIRFSPDGKSILLMMRTERGDDESWLVPFPAGSPKRILQSVRSYSGTPEFSWLPDGRRLVISASPQLEAPPQLWLGDIGSGAITALTSGTAPRRSPAVSPDGTRIVFAEAVRDFDVASVDLDHGSAERLIATERGESMPAWAANARALVYVSDRRGPREIWYRDHAGDRPVVTEQTFPDGRTEWFMGPALSPDGARIAYVRIEFGSSDHLWISSPAGGAPVRLTNDQTSAEFPGSWSSDGNWFVYLAVRNGSQDLMKAKTSGQAAPVLVKAGVDCETPSWSPDGKWIVCTDLISPDGQTVHALPKIQTRNYTFSGDSKLLYGLREEPDAVTLFSLDIASGAQKNIGKVGAEFRPQSDLHPAIRFSLAPDGKSFVYATAKYHSNLWTLSGALKP